MKYFNDQDAVVNWARDTFVDYKAWTKRVDDAFAYGWAFGSLTTMAVSAIAYFLFH